MSTRINQDYREFLKRTFEKKKLASPNLSYQFLASKAGVTKSYFKMVFDKKRHLNLDRFFILAEYFNLSEYDKQFILFKILKATTDHKLSKDFFQSILLNFESRGSLNSTDKLKTETTEMDISNWLFMAIYSLANLDNFNPSPAWIQKILGGQKIVTQKKIKWALDRLIKNTSLVNVGGKLVPNQINKIADPKVWNDDEFKTYRTGLIRSQMSLDSIGDNDLNSPCRYHMYTIMVSNENAKKLVSLYDELEIKILEILNQEQIGKGDRLMFISNNVFPITINDVDKCQ